MGFARMVVVTLFVMSIVIGYGTPSVAQDARPEQITLGTYGITIDFRSSDKKVAVKVAEICNETIPALSSQLGLGSVRPFRVFLIPDMQEYQERMQIRLPSWGIAFAFMENQIMLVDVRKATNAWNSLEKVIPHELSHLLLAQRAGDVQFPLWFMEGLAQWQAGEWSIIENWRLMEAVWGNRAQTLMQISQRLPADQTGARNAYRVAYAGFAHRFGEQTENLPAFLDEVVRQGNFGDAFNVFWGESEYEFAAGFAKHLDHKYRSRLLIFQTGPLFTLLAFLFLIGMLRIWIRNRRKLKEMEERERGLAPRGTSRFRNDV
jgi:hypothetical protein